MFANRIPRNAFDIRLKKASFDEYLHSISGLSPQWNLQEIDGLVAGAWNTAVPLGRELVINGAAPIAFTGDAPDDWAIVEPVNTEITERGTGQLNAGGGTGAINFYNNGGTGNRPVITQTYSGMTGKTIFYTIVISAYGSGTLELVSNTSEVQFTSVDTFTGTLDVLNQSGNVDIRLEGNGDITVDSISFMQTGILASSAYPSAELLNTAGASGTATAANFTPISDPTLSNPNVGELRIAILGADNTGLAEQDSLTIGVRYVVMGEARTNGANNARARIYHNLVGVTLWTGTLNTTTWEGYEFEFVAVDTDFNPSIVSDGSGDTYSEFRNMTVKPANPLNGDDTATTVGVATGLASMPYARTFNGATSYIELPPDYNSILDPATFSAFIFAKPSWDASERDFFSHTIDANNYIRVGQSATAGTARWEIMADGNLNSRTLATGAPVAFGLFGISCEGGVMKAIYNGVQVGADIALVGTVIGNFLTMIIGTRNDTPTNVVDGDMMQYDSANRALTAVEWSGIDQRSGI